MALIQCEALERARHRSWRVLMPAPVATVEVWQGGLAREDLVPRLEALLTDAERERAARLKRPGRADRWIVARAALRVVLCKRLGGVPEAVELSLSEHGKPYVTGQGLRFNLSHSGDRAVI